MYRDGILSWLVWFKMEAQQRGQLNCGLAGDLDTAETPAETTEDPNEKSSMDKIFILQTHLSNVFKLRAVSDEGITMTQSYQVVTTVEKQQAWIPICNQWLLNEAKLFVFTGLCKRFITVSRPTLPRLPRLFQ